MFHGAYLEEALGHTIFFCILVPVPMEMNGRYRVSCDKLQALTCVIVLYLERFLALEFICSFQKMCLWRGIGLMTNI